MNARLLLFPVCISILIMACSGKESADTNESTGTPVVSEKQKFTVDTVATGLASPWGMTFLPDGRLLITEKAGEIRIVENGQLSDTKVSGVPAVDARGQGGLLDIQLHPDYATNGWIYLTYSRPSDAGTEAGTALARAKLVGNALTDLEVLFQALPLVPAEAHYGSRIAFDGQGYVFVSSGERTTKENAQDLGNHLGKILRLHDDGRVPADNPFVNTPGAKPEIWSYGHRNPQGLFFDRATGQLWNHEHGPKGGDELNLVLKGKNYGWPVISYGINYDGTILTELKEKEGMEQPIRFWVPSIAPCGLTMVTSDRYPNWKGNFIVGALAFQLLARVEVTDQKFIKEERLLEGVGRVRAVVQSPDGYLYFSTENPGKIMRLVPIE